MTLLNKVDGAGGREGACLYYIAITEANGRQLLLTVTYCSEHCYYSTAVYLTKCFKENKM